jgi:hypothetical protein
MKKEIPILFSTQMVQAILAGRKTMTRRIVKNEHVLYQLDVNKWLPKNYENGEGDWCPYGKPSDLLWVREKWYAIEREGMGIGNQFIVFENEWLNNDVDESSPYRQLDNFYKWGCHPSIHLSKSVSRIWLEVTDIRVERLQNISVYDAGDEGVEYWNVDADAFEGGELVADYKNYMWRDDENYADYHFPTFANPIESFRTLWQSINGIESWDVNPWVWVVSFKVLSTTGRPIELPAAQASVATEDASRNSADNQLKH